MRVLVTGGAGFVGATLVRTLVLEGHAVVVVDDLSTGHREDVHPDAMFVQGDVGDPRLADLISRERVEAVVHLAARSIVGESNLNPQRYWRENVGKTIALLDSVLDQRTPPCFVFSSTAAVYGVGRGIRVRLSERDEKAPISTYGRTKLTIETILGDYQDAYGLRCVSLRYFNAAGAWPEAGLGERHDPETHLIPRVLDAAAGREPCVRIYGQGRSTTDGTCERDYVHVRDLAEAHLRSVRYLLDGGASLPMNVGTGRATSVLEIARTAERVTGRELPIVYEEARTGDPDSLVADPSRSEELLGWRAERDAEACVRDAWKLRR